MKFEIRGKNVKVTKAIETYVEEKMEKIHKYFHNPENLVAHVLLIVKGREQSIEVTIPTDNFTIRAEECDEDLYAAIDLVIDKIERQIRKNKTKLTKINKDKVKEFILSYETEQEQDDKKIVKRKELDTKPMNEEEAILQMDMLGHDFFIFKDAEQGSINVLYKRKDGNYGIIETK